MDINRNNQYQRFNAVAYAKRYALTPNPAFKYFKVVNNMSGDCTNFISQCLYAGNAPMIYNGRNPWWYNTRIHSWSLSWAVAHSLYWYLKTNQAKNFPGIKGLEVKNKNLLELGDLIFYKDHRGVVVHSAIITSFYNNEPLVSQHSDEALDINYINPRDNYIPHFVKIII